MSEGFIKFRDPITSQGINKSRVPFFEPGRYHGFDDAVMEATDNSITLRSIIGYQSGDHDNQTSSYRSCIVTQQGLVLTWPSSETFPIALPAYSGSSPIFFGIFMEYEYSLDPVNPGTPVFVAVQADGSQPIILDDHSFYISNSDAMDWLASHQRASYCLVGLVENNGKGGWPNNVKYRYRITPDLAGKDPLTFKTSKLDIQGDSIVHRLRGKIVQWMDFTLGSFFARGIKIGVKSKTPAMTGMYDDQWGIYIIEMGGGVAPSIVGLQLHVDQAWMHCPDFRLHPGLSPSHNDHPVPLHYFNSQHRWSDGYTPDLEDGWGNWGEEVSNRVIIKETPDFVEISGRILKTGTGHTAFYIKESLRPSRDLYLMGLSLASGNPSHLIAIESLTGAVDINVIQHSGSSFNLIYSKNYS